MYRLSRTVVVICILSLLSGCSNTSSYITTATTHPSFGSSTEPETNMTEVQIPETDESSEESSQVEEPSSEESSSEILSTEESTSENSTETSPQETQEELNFIDVNEQVTATAAVNVRAGHSTDSDILAVLARGDAVTRIGYHEKWSKIIYNGEECFVSSAYLTTETLPPETEPATTEAPTTEPTTTAPVITAPGFQAAFWNNLENVTFSGRWFTKDFNYYTHYTTLNAGSEFDFQITGSEYVFVYFSALGTNASYYAYSVDGQAPVRQHISEPTIPLGSTGTHTVRVIIDSLGESGSRWNEEIGVGLAGIYPNGGTISQWSFSGNVLAFYGDSITEGIRTLSTSEHSYINSYTWYCSQSLNALPYVCGFPGSGITTAGTFNTCTNAIEFYSSSRGAASYAPSIIVLAQGTNDVYTDSAAFIAAYDQTLDLLHIKFPNAKIACMIPLSQAHADDIRSCTATRDWCGVVETASWNVTYTDGIHPDASSAATIGYNLADALRVLFS